MAASDAFKLLIDNLQRSSRLDANVLINGEVGTGRRQCALSIHKASRRAQGRFVTVNCTALNDSRFGVEMFGMQNSAYEMVRKGALFLAEEGTLYLHEVAELSLEMQAQLVRYLESSVFTPVGSNDVIASNVRLVCTTSANLTALVEAGRFRNDLYHMMAQMVINTPTLNERIADMDLLAANILREIAPDQPYQIDRQAYNRLLSHSFTGNLIELRNIMLRAISQSTSYVINDSVMQFAITGGSVFSQNQDLQDRVLSIESTMQSADDNPLAISQTARSTQISAPEESNQPVVEPNELNDARRRGRWNGAEKSQIDTGIVDSKLQEFAAASPSLDEINSEQSEPSRTPYAPSQTPKSDPMGSPVSATPPSAKRAQNETLSLKERELQIIEELLIKHGGDKQAVAAELGCTVRTLYRKIEKIKAR